MDKKVTIFIFFVLAIQIEKRIRKKKLIREKKKSNQKNRVKRHETFSHIHDSPVYT